MKGESNPNYKFGAKESKCSCGELKDYRAKECAKCACVGFTKEGAKRREEGKDLVEIIKSSKSFLEASNISGLSRKSLALFSKDNNLDLSHMVKCRDRKFSPEEVLIITGTRSVRNSRNTVIKRVVLENNLLEYKCYECPTKDVWNDKPLRLELDHINGNNQDNRIENLRFLCPNCHTQQPTCRGGNNRGKKRKRRKENYPR